MGLVVLAERFGVERSIGDTLAAVRDAAAELVVGLASDSPSGVGG
jgi:hypothetical protein